MITITLSDGTQHTVDVVKKIKESELYKNDEAVQAIPDATLEAEYVDYTTNYGFDTPVAEVMIDNILNA